jgi:hypothetical protein
MGAHHVDLVLSGALNQYLCRQDFQEFREAHNNNMIKNIFKFVTKFEGNEIYPPRCVEQYSKMHEYYHELEKENYHRIKNSNFLKKIIIKRALRKAARVKAGLSIDISSI